MCPLAWRLSLLNDDQRSPVIIIKIGSRKHGLQDRDKTSTPYDDRNVPGRKKFRQKDLVTRIRIIVLSIDDLPRSRNQFKTFCRFAARPLQKYRAAERPEALSTMAMLFLERIV